MEPIAGIRECSECGKEFSIYENDLSFYQRMDVPPPFMCFNCRLQRRLAFYNRRSLYKRTCDFSGKPIVSMFSPDKPYKVYEKDVWFSDKWDPLEYGRAFDFSRPFFPQFAELLLDVPQMSLGVVGQNINSDFTNDNQRLKNCYLTYDCSDADGVLYGETFVRLKDCVDVLALVDSELCYECTVCSNCYNLKFSQYCRNCSDSWFMRDCIGCRHCFGCANLKQKEYCIFNEQQTRDAYERFLKSFASQDRKRLREMQRRVEDFHLSQYHRAFRGLQNENVVGDFVSNSRNVYWCFNSESLEDCRYCTDIIMGAKDSQDIHTWGDNMELCYNSVIVGEAIFKVMCSCAVAIGCSEIVYSSWCTRNCHHLLGCSGLQRKEYCILNRPYSQAEYEKLYLRIVKHMRDTGEWGLFFPPDISPFGYNESLAPAYFPLSREEVLRRGWKWCDYVSEVKAARTLNADEVPSDLDAAPSDITNTAVGCEKSGRLFKFTQAELDFYRAHRLPLPVLHPEERHLSRFQFKKSYNLTSAVCSRCRAAVLTSVSGSAAKNLLCEECYSELLA